MQDLTADILPEVLELPEFSNAITEYNNDLESVRNEFDTIKRNIDLLNTSIFLNYKEIKKLYSTRSKAVHGAKLSQEQIHKHVLEVRTILSRILCRYIEEGEVFSEERIENEMFGISGNVPHA